MTELLFGDGAIADLRSAVADYPGPILVLTGTESFESSGASGAVESGLRGRGWSRVAMGERLPGDESATRCLDELDGMIPSVAIAVGGGAVIDTAKLVCLALTNEGIDPLFERRDFSPAIPLVAVPTTAGSGAERTPFAVAYKGAEKHSIAHPSLAPVCAIVDPELTYSSPRDLTVATGLDALSHAIESLWSTQATADSRDLSRRALYLAWNTISSVADAPNRSSRSLMAEASTTAGAAIAIARTTASHALSYHLTWHFGVPHGPAVALTLPSLIEFNDQATAEDTVHPAGAQAVRAIVAEIADVMGVMDGVTAKAALHDKLRALGSPTALSDVGVVSDESVKALVDSVNRERLANNPRRLSTESLATMIDRIR